MATCGRAVHGLHRDLRSEFKVSKTIERVCYVERENAQAQL
jgi:hypothetical protein